MTKKVVFLDIDGTIYNAYGEIPQSTLEAVAKARKCGHQILLCTGRSEGEIPKSLWAIGLDGMIGGAGCSIRYKDEMLFHRPMKEEWVKELWELYYGNGIACVVETNDYIYGPEEGIRYIKAMLSERRKVNPNLPDDFLGTYKVSKDPYQFTQGVNKFLFFDAPYSFSEAEEMLHGKYTIVPNSVLNYGGCSGEVSELGMSKASGMEYFLEKTGYQREDTIAIGDGVNDMQMIDYAGTGVAMGNAVDVLKEKADLVTDSVDEDGIYNVFSKLGLF